MTLAERFWNKVSPEPMSGCWIWLGAVNPESYGKIHVGSMKDGTRRTEKAHRVAYELFRGPIPDGMTIDHLCRTHCCVNPAHLEAVSRKENILRGTGPTAQNSRKTLCIRGHSLSPDNIKVRKGWRICKRCLSASSKQGGRE